MTPHVAGTRRAPTIEVYPDPAGGFRWRLIDRRGERLCTSDRYATRYAATSAALAVQQLGPKAVVKEV